MLETPPCGTDPSNAVCDYIHDRKNEPHPNFPFIDAILLQCIKSQLLKHTYSICIIYNYIYIIYIYLNFRMTVVSMNIAIPSLVHTRHSM